MRITAIFCVPAVLTCLTLFSESAAARTYTFDPAMLGEAGVGADISLFNEGAQLPGTYMVDILLNGQRVDSREVVFSLVREDNRPVLYPCLSVEQLARYGVRTEDFQSLDNGSGCADLSILPGTTYNFSFSEQQLRLSVPQIHLRPASKGIAPQSLWDDGIPAFLMNYSASTSRTELRGNSGKNSDSSFAQLSPGLNAGAWRLRSQSNWQKQENTQARWQTSYTYAERGLRGLRSRLSLGDRTTEDKVFNGVPFRGVMLASDELMVPYTERAFAPMIRGIARTQARVEVRQGGYLLYETTVAPGPFALRDLTLAGRWGGELQVSVRESDGSQQTFSVPYQTPAVSLKEGYLSYGLMAGQYRPADHNTEAATIGQAVLLYGLPYDLTIYGGLQGAKAYQSAALGLGVSLGNWGSASFDVTGAQAQLRDQDKEQGTAWRVRYSKLIDATDTTLTVAGYRHATPGFATIEETLNSYGRTNPTDSNLWYNRSYGRMRSTTSIAVSQAIGRFGSLGINYSITDYWHHDGNDNNYGLSYGMGLPWGARLSLSQSRTRSTTATGAIRNESLSSLWLSLPLTSRADSTITASYQGTMGRSGDTHSLGLNGSALDRRLNWDVRQARSLSREGPSTNNGYMHLGWSGAYGNAGTGYSYNTQQRTVSAELNGGMILHENGLTFGQNIPGTVSLVQAPGAAGVSVSGTSGVRTDYRGYTLHPSVTPYQENIISLDPLSLADDVEITQTDVRVVPTRGAVVTARFNTRSGARALMRLTRVDGSGVPFGALVTVSGAEGGAGVAGAGGEVYLTGLPVKGKLLVRWSGSECSANYTLPASPGASGVHTIQATCR
ncbi:pilin outer membrane usher protein SafC (plasmid) [Enterobacter sp. N18-03635]|uniref:fimbria/pilus outer membrane usher protein n=1 Tax=Enterobacter sp. N18-03635 TaxID=2500132 RepID=UPI000FDC3410|nr:fimbria/pilus outer membrane usher protein [Enterobacter sp. N18-03635]AZV03712.1 pilin outer membrane usher protein SafC [Enterobacter sp. N18-03635]